MKKGFSFIEIILVVGILLIIAAGSFGFGGGLLNSNSVENVSQQVFTFIRTAQINSMSGKANSTWGVDTTVAGQIRLYAVSDVTQQKIESYSNMNVSSFNITFDSSGNPSSNGNVYIISKESKSQSFYINQYGAVILN